MLRKVTNTTMKKSFLNNEIWILTFGGAFQRANIYKQNYPEKTRTAFRKALREQVEKQVNEKYQEEVTARDHINQITSLVNFSNTLKIEGVTIPINFGVAQKLLNLYLKYLWCLDELNFCPPHFPVDRVIQMRLNEVAKKNAIPMLEVKAWTQFNDASKYIKVVDFAKHIRDNVEEFKNYSLALLELKLFDRR